MIPLRWLRGPVRPLYPYFSEMDVYVLMVSSGSCAIGVQRATDITGHLSSTCSVCTVTRLVWRICGLERWYRVWYVQCPTLVPG